MSDGIWKLGSLVQIKSGMWSMEASLEAKDIEKDEQDIPDFMRLGYKRLFPKEVRNRFTSIVSGARNQSSRFGFDFFLTGAYFVPNTPLEGLLPRLSAASEEFNTTVDSFLSKYESEKISFLNTFPEHRKNLEPYYPNVEVIKDKFYFSVWCYKISSPAMAIGEFAQLTDEDYIGWATSALNDLRQEATDVANIISQAAANDEVDGRTLRRVTSLVERLSTLDLLEDTSLLNAARNLFDNPTVGATTELKKAASPVRAAQIRKLILD